MCSFLENSDLSRFRPRFWDLSLKKQNQLRGPIGPRKKITLYRRFSIANIFPRSGVRNHRRHCLACVYGALACKKTQPEGNKYILKHNKQCNATPPLRVFLCSFWKSWDLSFRHGLFSSLTTYGPEGVLRTDDLRRSIFSDTSPQKRTASVDA